MYRGFIHPRWVVWDFWTINSFSAATFCFTSPRFRFELLRLLVSLYSSRTPLWPLGKNKPKNLPTLTHHKWHLYQTILPEKPTNGWNAPPNPWKPNISISVGQLEQYHLMAVLMVGFTCQTYNVSQHWEIQHHRTKVQPQESRRSKKMFLQRESIIFACNN